MGWPEKTIGFLATMRQVDAVVSANDVFVQRLLDLDEGETATVTRAALRQALDACELPVK